MTVHFPPNNIYDHLYQSICHPKKPQNESQQPPGHIFGAKSVHSMGSQERIEYSAQV